MKLVQYLRVSTDRQANDGMGLDVQRQHIRAWAKANGHKIVATFTDAGVSGRADLTGRLGLADALESIRAGKAEGVIVYRLDRLARDMVLQEQLLGEIRRLGGVLFSESATECAVLADDADDPSRRLMRQVLGAVAEYDRAMVVLRLARGRRAKAQAGGFAGYGSPSFGQRAEGGELVDDDDEMAAVRRAVGLRAEGLSLRQIGQALDAEGLRPKRGGGWHPNGVRRVLDRHDRAA